MQWGATERQQEPEGGQAGLPVGEDHRQDEDGSVLLREHRHGWSQRASSTTAGDEAVAPPAPEAWADGSKQGGDRGGGWNCRSV